MQQSNPQAQPDTSPIPDFSKAAKHYERSAPGAAECLSVEDLCLFYGQHQALFNVNMSIREKRVTAFIGPSGCGKSTLLRCCNRLNELIGNVRTEGAINLKGENIYSQSIDISNLRRRVRIPCTRSMLFVLVVKFSQISISNI